MEELNRFVPGLGTLMPEIGTRAWKLYYAAEAGNWRHAEFQAAEIQGLMNIGAMTRPLYEESLKSFTATHIAKLREAIANKDFEAFAVAFDEMIIAANEIHTSLGRDYIVWMLPDTPPPDLDFTPKS
ncbi:MAG: hypothetical protein GEU75_07110 [Dehalococcoidia bacterium]|nr:hypothetical protein [Dehalococcoidia bacterium]